MRSKKCDISLQLHKNFQYFPLFPQPPAPCPLKKLLEVFCKACLTSWSFFPNIVNKQLVGWVHLDDARSSKYEVKPFNQL